MDSGSSSEIDAIQESPPQSLSGGGVDEEKEFVETIKWENAKKQAEVRGLNQDINERKTYADRIFVLIKFWVIGVFFIILLQGFMSESDIWIYKNVGAIALIASKVKFKLSEPVMLALLGGTTASVLGLFIIVANYLFPKR